MISVDVVYYLEKSVFRDELLYLWVQWFNEYPMLKNVSHLFRLIVRKEGRVNTQAGLLNSLVHLARRPNE